MRKYYYTLWKGHDEADEAVLLEDEQVFKIKHRAFKRAEFLANELAYGCGFFILVRKVCLDSNECLEWKIEPVEQNTRLI